MSKNRLKELAKLVLPAPVRRWMRETHVRATERPPYKMVRFGSFRRVTPIHAGFGIGRGLYVDRYYIERFLLQNAACVKGRVLEFAENEYTLRFGGDRVTQSDIIDVRHDYPLATIVADLTVGDNIPSDAFDCVIMTQVLNFIYDVRAAIKNSLSNSEARWLCACIGRWHLADRDRGIEYCGDYWRFTRLPSSGFSRRYFPRRMSRWKCMGMCSRPSPLCTGWRPRS